jgi:hypothetical protein
VHEVSHCSGSPESVFPNTISNPPHRFLCSQEAVKEVLENAMAEVEMDMIIMECEACGYSTQGYKKGRLKKRLEIYLSKCTVATSCKVEQHQFTSPADLPCLVEGCTLYILYL